MRFALVLLLVAVAACKDKQAKPAPAAPPPAPSTGSASSAAPISGSAGSAVEERPQAATTPKQPLGAPLSTEDAAKVIPKLDAAKEILPLRQTSDKRQVHATWCIDGTGADDVAKSVGKQMAAAGYKDLSIRGDAKKAGVQGARDGFRMSMIVSASSAANCPAPQHYFGSATIFRD